MDDTRIVDLYWAREERAIEETKNKYERMLSGISFSLLNSAEDAEECVNDTYVSAWNRMPNDRPAYLGAYLSKIVRGISIDRFRSRHRKKRGGYEELTAELSDCIPDDYDVQREYENGRLRHLLGGFLECQSEEKRIIFVRRYFYSDSVEDIAKRLRIGTPKVKTTLFRMRKELKQILTREGML